MESGRPSDDPPGASGAAAIPSGASRPEGLGGASPAYAEPDAPSDEGPGAQAAGASIWQSDKRITAVWMIAEARNAWINIDGVGWRRLYDGSDAALTALTQLAVHAEVTQTSVKYREDGDGKVHELYVW